MASSSEPDFQKIYLNPTEKKHGNHIRRNVQTGNNKRSREIEVRS